MGTLIQGVRHICVTKASRSKRSLVRSATAQARRRILVNHNPNPHSLVMLLS